jgi:diguanylate cyclase (GGDEF)-like protein
MQASDWVTETGLQAFDRIERRNMWNALGRAAATDLLTGLPDRDLFNRHLFPQAIEEYDRVALVVFDVANFSETVASGEIAQARKALLRLAEAVGKAAPESTVRARFGDDEICVILPRVSAEEAYRMAEEVLERLVELPGDMLVDAGVAVYPEHGRDAGEVVAAAMGALRTAKRVGGSGIIVARERTGGSQ